MKKARGFLRLIIESEHPLISGEAGPDLGERKSRKAPRRKDMRLVRAAIAPRDAELRPNGVFLAKCGEMVVVILNLELDG